MKGTVAERYILERISPHPKLWGTTKLYATRKNPWRNLYHRK